MQLTSELSIRLKMINVIYKYDWWRTVYNVRLPAAEAKALFEELSKKSGVEFVKMENT